MNIIHKSARGVASPPAHVSHLHRHRQHMSTVVEPRDVCVCFVHTLRGVIIRVSRHAR